MEEKISVCCDSACVRVSSVLESSIINISESCYLKFKEGFNLSEICFNIPIEKFCRNKEMCVNTIYNMLLEESRKYLIMPEFVYSVTKENEVEFHVINLEYFKGLNRIYRVASEEVDDVTFIPENKMKELSLEYDKLKDYIWDNDYYSDDVYMIDRLDDIIDIESAVANIKKAKKELQFKTGDKVVLSVCKISNYFMKLRIILIGKQNKELDKKLKD